MTGKPRFVLDCYHIVTPGEDLVGLTRKLSEKGQGVAVFPVDQTVGNR